MRERERERERDASLFLLSDCLLLDITPLAPALAHLCTISSHLQKTTKTVSVFDFHILASGLID